ncbi:hypothetical protein PRMUPPPA20_02200 [Xylanibacter ruminicola]|uniref:Uncharacterized protein n=2 Tax=Xylanibacter ruminicola TaxID=839 RepID=D5EXE9_XYLR2|nr:hypothetical protein [Xylanibacter ruminicola]ADE82480.1 hypothetical protein PRU_2644 [Xylanibacter ruminicola 23]GJG32111.1 hypothetical protein PRMUPPPA20_02200 [Xylanibacter ruminicola]SEH84599.1 hypothetical protein SAMN02745192_1772 [Xylanibacter ruminicola]
MAQIETASVELAWVEKNFFKGAGLDKASRLKGDERRAYRLAQVERLLATPCGYTTAAIWLSDRFWTAEEGRKIYEKDPNPLLLLKEQQTLEDDEMARLRLILEVAGLCHDLSLHYTFNLDDAFGVENNFWASNKQLVEWLTTTEYENIAMHTAYIMKKYATGVYACGRYQPAQDALAELFSVEYGKLIREPERTEMPSRAYVKIVLDELIRIDEHWKQGRKKRLRPDLILLHDEIYGVVPNQFDNDVLKAAKALYNYMDNDVYGRMVGNNPFGPEALKLFAKKVREVRAEYLAEGWVADDSLEFAYLMAHAESCANGWWREEDEAL